MLGHARPAMDGFERAAEAMEGGGGRACPAMDGFEPKPLSYPLKGAFIILIGLNGSVAESG